MRIVVVSAALVTATALLLAGVSNGGDRLARTAGGGLTEHAATLAYAPPAQWTPDAHDRRSVTTDQPDLTHLPTIHPVYIYPSDQPNRFADLAAYFEAEHRRAGARLAATTGMTFRWDERVALDGTQRVVHDITVIRSKNNLRTLSSGKQFGLVREMLAAAGLNKPGKKYQVWLDAKSDNCGAAQPTGEYARTVSNKANAMSYTVMYRPNGGETMFAAVGGFCAPVLHELSHALGAVPDWAPNAIGGGTGHCNDDNQDILCSTGPVPFDSSAPRTYDFGNNDYLDPSADLNPDAVATAGADRLPWWTVNLSRFLCPRSAGDRTVPDCATLNAPTY